mmetsp:Transcript_3920/g.4010  ORF Transcript_3920/g.4010 Transcript_3920/m.4010 type:complete len:91 (-) Transcript_3920:202-474(-)
MDYAIHLQQCDELIHGLTTSSYPIIEKMKDVQALLRRNADIVKEVKNYQTEIESTNNEIRSNELNDLSRTLVEEMNNNLAKILKTYAQIK